MLHRDLWRPVLLAAALAALLIAAPAAAQVQRQYHGTTPQGYEARITGSPEGEALRIEVAYRIRCRRHGFTERGLLETSPPTFASSRREFAIVESAVGDVPDEEDRSAGVEIALTGRRVTRPGRPGTEFWQMTLEVEVEVRDDETGAVRERCRTRRMRWRAWREGFGTGRWDIVSDPGEYVGEGKLYSLGVVSAVGDARGIAVWGGEKADDSAFSWSASFSPPRGGRLRRGATYVAVPDDDTVDDAGLGVSGPGDFCDYVSGEFTIDAIRFDARGRLRAVRLRFTQWCGPRTGPALRGTIRYRSRP